MDPNVTLAALLDAFRDGNREAAWSAIWHLTDWLAKGGFMPADPRRPADHVALVIQELLDGRIWSPDTLDDIAAVLTENGYRVRDKNDVDLPAHDPHFEARQVLNELLDWEALMGGWDAPVWKRARAFRDSLFPKENQR